MTFSKIVYCYFSHLHKTLTTIVVNSGLGKRCHLTLSNNSPVSLKIKA